MAERKRVRQPWAVGGFRRGVVRHQHESLFFRSHNKKAWCNTVDLLAVSRRQPAAAAASGCAQADPPGVSGAFFVGEYLFGELAAVGHCGTWVDSLCSHIHTSFSDSGREW
jgi:hypothetical protein